VNVRRRSSPSFREFGESNYFRENVAGTQGERWVHRSGCSEWCVAERDTRTNDVLVTALPGAHAAKKEAGTHA
jgi:heterotetrameric sarcosine oxidase delta subunit